MKDQPLSSNELGKITIFILLSLPPIFFMVGIIPVLFILFGIYMMKRTGDFSHVETAVRNYRYYVFILLALSIVFSMYHGAEYNEVTLQVVVGLIVSCVSLFYIFIVDNLFLSPLKLHADWVVTNGIFSGENKKSSFSDSDVKIDIIRGERLRTFSVADELNKWAKLKENGHITEQEFNEVRKKLLRRD